MMTVFVNIGTLILAHRFSLISSFFFFFFLVGYVEERLWWPIQSSDIGPMHEFEESDW